MNYLKFRNSLAVAAVGFSLSVCAIATADPVDGVASMAEERSHKVVCLQSKTTRIGPVGKGSKRRRQVTRQVVSQPVGGTCPADSIRYVRVLAETAIHTDSTDAV